MAILKFRFFARACTEKLYGATVMFNNYDEIINDCFNDFAAAESEHNWSKRAALCARLSAQLEKSKPSVPKDFYDRIRPLMTSFLGAATSERTSLSIKACTLLASISKTIGSLIHPHLDYILPKLIVICGSTKKISQNSGNDTIMTICQTAGYSPRLLHHICAAFNEKNKFIKKFAPIWLTTIIHLYQHVLDADKDYPLIEKAIIAGLNDGEKETREGTRVTYWAYAKLEKNTANKIMDGLNPHAATALRADPNNPNKSSEPSKQTRPESALAQIRAAKTKQVQSQQNAKRNTTPMSTMSIQSADLPFGPIDRVDAPDGALVPLPASPTYREKSRKLWDESQEETLIRKGLKKPSPKPYAEPEGASLKTLMAAPIRRPRVVATPMSTQNHSIARPTSKGEISKKSNETIERPAIEKRGGRQTPTILEDNDARSHVSVSTKSSRHIAQKSDSLKTSTTRPSSSSSEPAGIKSPKRQATRSKPIDVPPTLGHQKSSSASEPMSDSTLAAALKTMSPPGYVIDGKENVLQKPTMTQAGDSVDKARRSLSAVTEALRQGKIDALGYRKLRKLVETCPKQLFITHEQFDEFYTLLIESMASIEEYSEPREQRAANLNHPFYNRITMIHIAISLLEQYPQYGEPQPGMTLVALLKARGNHVQGHHHAVDSISTATQMLLRLPTTTEHSHSIIDTMTDTLLEIEQIILSTDPIDTPSTLSRPPATAMEKARTRPIPTHFHNGPLSHTSEFGEETPKVPNRLPIVMGFGLHILTILLLGSAAEGRRLYDVQELRLAELARNVLATYKQLIKRQIMGFCSALHAIIKPEERFFAFFDDESDRNLITYCVNSHNPLGRGRQGYPAKKLDDPRLLPTPESGSSWSGASAWSTTGDSGNWDILGVTESGKF